MSIFERFRKTNPEEIDLSPEKIETSEKNTEKEIIDRSVIRITEEAKKIIPDITPDSGMHYLQSSSGLLRIGRKSSGKLYITGHEGEGLTEIAKRVAEEIDAELV